MNIDVFFPPKMRFLFKPSRYKAAYGGRGSGKSWSIARALLLIGKQPDLLWPGWSDQYGREGIRVLCYRETMRSIEESVHQLLTDQIRLLRLGDFYHIQQKNIVGNNGTEFFFAGVRQSVDNLKSYEGVHIAWGSQAEAMSKRSLGVVFPTLRRDILVRDKKYGSELWFDFNPEFEDDEVYKLFAVEANRPEGARTAFVNWQDNPYFPEVLQKERADLMRRDPDECEHVYGGMCRSAVEGAIYKKEIQLAETEGRLGGRVPWDATKNVQTFWDIGPAHTRIWFAQSFPFEFRIIDYLQGEFEALSHYIKELKERPYTYGMHMLPWDGEAKELGSGRSIKEQMQAIFGVDRVRCATQLSVEDGIAAVRAIFPKCWFDHEKTKEGMRGMRSYQYEYDKDLRTYSRKPLHDWACFTPETKVLTRYGTYAIMDLPENGEVLTPCGWKQYLGPRITRRNARLVEVQFSDGNTVRCTPDHLFLAESGWKYAESLTPNLAIQSCSIQSRNSLTGIFSGAMGLVNIIKARMDDCIAQYGSLLSGKFLPDVMFTTEMETSLIMHYQTWNASPQMNIQESREATERLVTVDLGSLQEDVLVNGIGQKQVDCGIAGKPVNQSHGQNGNELSVVASSVVKEFLRLFGAGDWLRSTAPTFANPLQVVRVTPLAETSDTCCIDVPDGHWFCLENGAVVHNSHDADAFRTLAVSIREHREKVEEKPKPIVYSHEQSQSWMA